LLTSGFLGIFGFLIQAISRGGNAQFFSPPADVHGKEVDEKNCSSESS